MFTVMVMRVVNIVARDCVDVIGQRETFVDRHSLMSGAVFEISSKVLKVLAGLASGSPGPATPKHCHLRNVDATASTFFAACSGVSFSLTTPGRDSLAQSYFRFASNYTEYCKQAPRRHAYGRSDDELPRCSKDDSSPSPRFPAPYLPGRRWNRSSTCPNRRCAAALVVGNLLHEIGRVFRTSTSKMEESSMVAPNEFKFREDDLAGALLTSRAMN